MSDRPRRALADDEEPEEIPEVRFVEEGAIPARRAAGSEAVSYTHLTLPTICSV